MATATLQPPDQATALRSCRNALRRIANYVLDPFLDERMLEMGERKEYLDAGEHAELMALVAFTEQRTLEKLEAEIALKSLQSVYPDLASMP